MSRHKWRIIPKRAMCLGPIGFVRYPDSVMRYRKKGAKRVSTLTRTVRLVIYLFTKFSYCRYFY